MAQLSDQLLVVAVLGYLAAMVAYVTEYVLGKALVRTPAATPAAAVPTPARELVSVGAPNADPVLVMGPPTSDEIASAETASQAGPTRSGPRWSRGAGALALGLTALTALVHAAVLVTRGLAAGRVPWGNMYEFVLTLALVAAVAWCVLALTRPHMRSIGLFVTLALALVLGFTGMVLYTKVAPLVPALNSYWLKIHVSAAALASGIFLVAFVPAALYLVRVGHDAGRTRFPYPLGRHVPAAPTLERLSFGLHAFAFPIWTFAVVAGAIWAEAAWGRYWGWDPKEVWSFISWVAYAAYLHARATPSVKTTVATRFAIAAWCTMLVNLYVINFVAVGMHSYAK